MINTDLLILDMIFETLPSGLLLFEADGNIIRMNAKARELLGLPESSAPSHFEEWPAWLDPLRAALLSADADIYRGEVTLRFPEREEENTLGFGLRLIEKEHGDAIRILTFSDITQVLKDRLAMDKIKDELGQSRKLASIGTMVAGVAHELNNPLTGISMSASLIKMNLERLKKQPATRENARLADSLEQALAEVAKISRANERAAALVGDLLAYSKPTQLELTPLLINELVAEIVGALKSHPQFSRFTFQLAGHADRMVLCDRVKMEQVFYNLFKNACDATEGKGTLSITYSDRVEGRHPYVAVHVRDNGPGIDKTIINRIFDPFFTTKGHSGVGLGLSISYRTVEQHGGMLSVESEKGSGTEFTVCLPVYLEEKAPG